MLRFSIGWVVVFSSLFYLLGRMFWDLTSPHGKGPQRYDTYITYALIVVDTTLVFWGLLSQ